MQPLELNSTPPLSRNPYYNGWDRTSYSTAGGVNIHHPAGDAKKISTYTGTPAAATWNDGTNIGMTNGHWNVTFVSTTNGHGVTVGESSGSPLFSGEQ